MCYSSLFKWVHEKSVQLYSSVFILIGESTMNNCTNFDICAALNSPKFVKSSITREKITFGAK